MIEMGIFSSVRTAEEKAEICDELQRLLQDKDKNVDD